MAQIQNSSTIKEIRRVGGLSIAEGFPTQLANQVLPIVECNPLMLPKKVLFASNGQSISGTLGILTPSSSRDTYLTGITLSIAKDASCDIATGAVRVIGTIGGVSVSLLGISCITLTAQNSTVTVQFTEPVKVDRSALISYNTTFTAGVCASWCTLNYFEIEAFENL